MFVRRLLMAALVAAPLAWNPADLAAQQRAPAPQASPNGQAAAAARAGNSEVSKRPTVPPGIEKAFPGKDLPPGIQRAFPNARPEPEPEPEPAPAPPAEEENCETTNHIDPITGEITTEEVCDGGV